MAARTMFHPTIILFFLKIFDLFHCKKLLTNRFSHISLPVQYWTDLKTKPFPSDKTLSLHTLNMFMIFYFILLPLVIPTLLSSIYVSILTVYNSVSSFKHLFLSFVFLTTSLLSATFLILSISQPQYVHNTDILKYNPEVPRPNQSSISEHLWGCYFKQLG